MYISYRVSSYVWQNSLWRNFTASRKHGFLRLNGTFSLRSAAPGPERERERFRFLPFEPVARLLLPSPLFSLFNRREKTVRRRTNLRGLFQNPRLSRSVSAESRRDILGDIRCNREQSIFVHSAQLPLVLHRQTRERLYFPQKRPVS